MVCAVKVGYRRFPARSLSKLLSLWDMEEKIGRESRGGQESNMKESGRNYK